jgi:hypothetical protein
MKNCGKGGRILNSFSEAESTRLWSELDYFFPVLAMDTDVMWLPDMYANAQCNI